MAYFSINQIKPAWEKIKQKRWFIIGGLAGLALVLAFWFLGGLFSLRGLGVKEGRTNILILGVGGAGHEAPDLTDTLIFASFDHTGKNPVLVSLPRDIWILSLRAKINTTYHYGNEKRAGGGMILSKSSVSEILGQPVHYAAVLDFVGFVETVDLLGGVEVEVERAFDDYKYPIPGREDDDCGGEDPEFSCRFEHIRFSAGKQIMDGQTALKFVRSRNAEGDEGTDFARAARQQKIILAIRQKLTSPKIFLNPEKISGLWRIFNESIETDIPRQNFLAAGRLFLTLRGGKIRSEVLNGGITGQEGLLYHPPISQEQDNQWVVIPQGGSWDAVRGWINCLLSERECPIQEFFTR